MMQTAFFCVAFFNVSVKCFLDLYQDIGTLFFLFVFKSLLLSVTDQQQHHGGGRAQERFDAASVASNITCITGSFFKNRCGHEIC